jgi:hypothetical protein
MRKGDVMNRRDFILTGLVASVATPVLGQLQPQFLNGELNHQMGTFDWSNGGGDPLQLSWTADDFRQSLAIPRLNLDIATQRGLRETLLQPAFDRVNLTRLYEARVIGDVMISGNGWVAVRPRLLSSQWQLGRSRTASWWSWTNRTNGERWEIIVPDVCRNLVLTRLGQAVSCRCGPQDACA